MSKRILVIEDQEDNRTILRDLLTSVGFELIEATNGEEGVKLAQQDDLRPEADSDHRRDVVRAERRRSQGTRGRMRRLRDEAVQPTRPARQGARVLAG